MPRVVPKTRTRSYQQHLDEQANLREASHEYARRKDEAFEQVSRAFGVDTLGQTDNGAYVDGERSWFLDVAFASGGDRLARLMPRHRSSAACRRPKSGYEASSEPNSAASLHTSAAIFRRR